jgi:hypothetical protein
MGLFAVIGFMPSLKITYLHSTYKIQTNYNAAGMLANFKSLASLLDSEISKKFLRTKTTGYTLAENTTGIKGK